MEWHLKHRPKQITDVVGQTDVVSLVNKMSRKKKTPRSILLVGPTGSGKTTIARILARIVKCRKVDFTEINTADFRGIEMVRSIRERMRLKPLDRKSKSRAWLIDEAHQLSSAAQHAFLKILEEPPENVHFFLATTEPGKLLKTITSRCTLLKLHSLTDSELESLIKKVSKSEKLKIKTDVIDKIVEYSEGSARQALVYLEAASYFDTKKEQLASIESPETKTQAFLLARELFKASPNWKTCVSIIEELDDDIENLRWMVLGYAKTVMKSGGKPMHRAYLMIDSFEAPFYDSGKAGLYGACYRVIFGTPNG